ncbi:hypothetical protein AVEN_154555-1 [Araneus ventricosus]|uniref:Uncharacterized protein n=1 Tax=Araneus ventricosus TaxID=182803 RepID=A0A4Y2A5G3_ARAVE|nr:hypothetical protein AVEN_273824-1 [Araneus ventricosus]GBL74974.1 hypothetical protein AVEN_10113-1 [Araneus ventricosus]GBL75020.1 hypothetical protein AVEN_60885-1 [Araneus ventricosus]GBL75101.1 hypothetical protein AVEN_154555-1 [Araneus ventricosus]
MLRIQVLVFPLPIFSALNFQLMSTRKKTYVMSQNSTYKLGGEVKYFVRNHNHVGKHGQKWIKVELYVTFKVGTCGFLNADFNRVPPT